MSRIGVTTQTIGRRELLAAAGAVGVGLAFGSASEAQETPGSIEPSRPELPPPVVVSHPAGGIPLKRFGTHGDTISALGLGGHHLGDLPTIDDAMDLVAEAIDSGVTFFDNCWEYHNGKSEDWLGRALKGKRDHVFLMTKVCTHGRSGALGLQMLEESLRRLQTDHLDLWQIHAVSFENDPDLAYAPDGILEAMVKAKAAGKIRYIGFTGHKDPAMHLRMLRMGFPFDAVQMPLNPFDANFLSFERQVVPEALRRGVTPLGMKSFGGTGDAITRSVVTAEEMLRYAMSLPVATTISGMDSIEILRQNLNVGRSFTPMTPEEMQALRLKCRAKAADGHFEPYKVSLKFDNPWTRAPHGFPQDQENKEVKDEFKTGIAVPGADGALYQTHSP